MDNSKSKHDENLGVKKTGKNIRKSPLHQPNYSYVASGRNQEPPYIYNISVDDFKEFVQRVTGLSSQNPPPPKPCTNFPKPQRMRLQKTRPPPLTHVRPQMSVPTTSPPVPYNNYNNTFHSLAQFTQTSPNPWQPLPPGDIAWTNTPESPISAYMRYFQNSHSSSWGNQVQQQTQPQPYSLQPLVPEIVQPYPASSALFTNPPISENGQSYPASAALFPNHPILENVQSYPPSSSLFPNHPIPENVQSYPHSSTLFPNPPMPNAPMIDNDPPVLPCIPSPQTNGLPILPSPNSQSLMPSSTRYMNFPSTQSPDLLLSPDVQFPSPFTPDFPFPLFDQLGCSDLGAQTELSPDMFPLSPSSGLFPVTSPMWRDD
ncbi:protein HAIKU1-like [Gastrolobium bilobum]|uniref:protein HAIKU1-like n=1 Tax=Gastrolobium bilobum TaxID=150636 RepID=UPI002AAFEAA9|nr:protein HAIKU1-like [Gastrolobium bilobum]